MTIAYLHLIRLKDEASAVHFSIALRQHATSYHYRVFVFSQSRYPVARAQVIDRATLDQNWTCMAFVQPTDDTQQGGSLVPNSLSHLVQQYYTLKVAASSSVLANFEQTNAELHARSAVDGAAFDAEHLETLRRKSASLRASSQNLEASEGLLDFASSLLPAYGLKPMTMLNLLSFNDNGPGLDTYKEYGRNFAKIGGKRGGNAKIVGKVLEPARLNGTKQLAVGSWDEFAIVHYPNIVAFCDMAAGEDYQEINHKYRLPALKDTLLFATREITLAAEPGQTARSEADLSGKL